MIALVSLLGGAAASAQSLSDERSLSAQLDDQDDATGAPEATEASEGSSPQADGGRAPWPDERAAKAFAPPPGAKKISRTSNLWVDPQQKRVYADGYVALRRGPLEMLACPVGTKEHESVVAVLAKSSEVHAALLAIGATPGTPVRYEPEFVPATGQQVRVWVTWRDEQGQFHVSDARRWIRKMGTQETLATDWVFAGSGFWKDPADGTEYYQADSGDMICVSNFSTAMMDVPFASSAQANELIFEPFTERIPEPGTPVRLVLVPIPVPTDQPGREPKVDPDQKPAEKMLPPKP